ncbi:hypothetical protein ACOTVS_12140 [Aliarcobacter butzleri]|uniref:hypothetical protein n=1 Tax=Aliarcobacter butzleri TaxID=28197 RepID=UPI00344E7B1D
MNLDDIKYCSHRIFHNNMELLTSLVPSMKTNQINFACINLLLNNKQNVEALLNLEIYKLKNILFSLPSQMQTLLCLNNFNSLLDEILKQNPNCFEQYELIKNFNYSGNSSFIKCISIVPALNNDNLNQMKFEF